MVKWHAQQREKIFELIKLVIPVLIILALCLYYIQDNLLIKICGDEFGYWASGSWIAGYDWSEVQSINSYYGYGYGLILAIILKLTRDQSFAYQIALFINATMLCGMYFMAYGTVKILDKKGEISNVVKVIISLVSILFSSNLFFTQFTMAETVLAFCYWIITYSFILLLDKFTLFRLIIFYASALFSVSIHLRTVGTLFVCTIMILALLYKHKIETKKLLFFLVFSILGCIVVLIFKQIYQNSYISNNDISSNANDLTGQLGKLQFLFTKSGIKMFFEGVCGKIFYAFNSTFLYAAIPLYVIIKCISQNFARLKIKKEVVFTNIDLIIIFLTMSTLSEILIDAVYMINYNNRFDLLTYGRYFEHTLTPLILLGILVFIYSDRKIERYIIVLSFVNLLLSNYVNKLQNYDTARTNVHINTSSFYEILIKGSYSESTWLAVGLKSIFILIIFYVLLLYFNKKKFIKSLQIIGLVIICIIWIKEAKFTYDKGCLSWTIHFQESEIKLADHILSWGIEDDLIFYNEGNNVRIMPLQFLLKEHTIKVENDINTIERSDNDYVLSVSGNEDGLGDLNETIYELVDQSRWLRLWKKRY